MNHPPSPPGFTGLLAPPANGTTTLHGALGRSFIRRAASDHRRGAWSLCAIPLGAPDSPPPLLTRRRSSHLRMPRWSSRIAPQSPISRQRQACRPCRTGENTRPDRDTSPACPLRRHQDPDRRQARCPPWRALKSNLNGYGSTVNPSGRTLEPTRTSQTRSRPPPPLFTATLAVIVLASMTRTVGGGFDPFSKLTCIPAVKPAGTSDGHGGEGATWRSARRRTRGKVCPRLGPFERSRTSGSGLDGCPRCEPLRLRPPTRAPRQARLAGSPALRPAARGLALCFCSTPGLRAMDATTFRNPGASDVPQRCGDNGQECLRTT